MSRFKEFANVPDQPLSADALFNRVKQLEDLPGSIRALLVADGTVTFTLEAQFLEPIKAHLIHQDFMTCDVELKPLGLGAGDRAFVREVDLIGVESGTRFANARAIVNPDQVADALLNDLVEGKEGIGVILNNRARGSFRDVLQIDDRPDNEGRISRIYRVLLETKPAILLRESFILSAFS